MRNKVILITGGCGSLGRVLVKECKKYFPKEIRVFDNDEYNLVDMRREEYNMGFECKDSPVRFWFGDVRDENRLKRAMDGVYAVIHCAALKHLDVCEKNPSEAISTNITGTANVVNAVLECGSAKAMFLSSDKAVEPSCVYGATKFIGERLFLNANSYGKALFSCLRSGNFLDSRGNILEVWRKQRENFEITLPVKDMIRYGISISEAARLTVGCLEKMDGGEIFVPRMIHYSMEELAKQVAPECKVRLIGGHDKDKRCEKLYSEDEGKQIESNGDCMVIRKEVKSE